MHGSRSSFASACCSGLLAALALGCGKPTDAGPHAAASVAASVSAAPAAAPSAVVDPLLTAGPVSSKSIGHTSYVLKLRLEGGAVAVFKPRSKLPLGDHRYRGEIAAYRLATALGLDNVPRAIPRSFDAAGLGALQSDFAEKGLPDDDGHIRGALMPWIDGYRVLPLEEKDSRARWEAWLFDARSNIPEDRRALAASVSTMIAFDYVTANWDRWSGGNVAEDAATGRVLFVDNDGAFYEGPDPAALARQRAMLQRVTRFSRRFVAALRRMNPASVRDALGDEAVGVALVSEKVVSGVVGRCNAVVAMVDARIGDAGEAETLVFE
jgi:hypothetical protein